jgi:manganese transport protein
MRFTGEKGKMGEFANGLWIKLFGWLTALIIITLNVKLLCDIFLPAAWMAAFYGALGLPAL